MNEDDCNKYRKLGINEVGDIMMLYDKTTLSQIGEILSLKIATLLVDKRQPEDHYYTREVGFLSKTNIQSIKGWVIVIVDDSDPDYDEQQHHQEEIYNEWVALVPTGSNLRRLVLANLDKIICLIEQLTKGEQS